MSISGELEYSGQICVGVVQSLLAGGPGHADMGDAASFETAVGRATETFDREAEQPGRSIFTFSPVLFSYWGAGAHVSLGQPRRAIEQAQQAVELCDAAPADWP